MAGWTPRGRRGGTGSANGPRWQGGPLFGRQIAVPRGSSVLAHVCAVDREDRGSPRLLHTHQPCTLSLATVLYKVAAYNL